MRRVADKFDLEHGELLAYAEEDTIGGYHHDKEERTCERGIWGVEGQVLYALIRAFKPSHVLEVGNTWGTSTQHICEALLRNGKGKLTTIDLGEFKVPARYKKIAKAKVSDLFDFNYKAVPRFDFVFEDGGHDGGAVTHVWEQFMKHAKKSAVIVSHDSEHFRLGPLVQSEIRQTNADYLSVAIAPADCGLAMWRKP
jgi:predicted O-methyltransferase YrrM